MANRIPLCIINEMVKDSALLNDSPFIIQFKEVVFKRNGQPDKRSVIQYAIMRKEQFMAISDAMVEKSQFTFARVELEIFNWVNHTTEESEFSQFVTVADGVCVRRDVSLHVGWLNDDDFETSLETWYFTYEILDCTGYISMKLHIGEDPKNIHCAYGELFQPYLEKNMRHLDICEVKFTHGKVSVFTNDWSYDGVDLSYE
jgi:hypothetical protein